MAGTSYFRIYNRAVTEFKDPTLKGLLTSDTILFSQSMYNFLENAISMFTAPSGAVVRLNNREEPTLDTETFEVAVATDTFVLTNPPTPELIDDYILQYLVDGVEVSGTYDTATSTVTLDEELSITSTLVVNIYYIGNFNVTLYDMEEYILSQFIVAAWSNYIMNNKLDIDRLLGDTDFKLPSNATTTNSKVNWNILTVEKVLKKMNKYSWDSRFNGTYTI